jgi:hypothetical protein
MDGRLQDFREDFAGAVSIWIVTEEEKRYQGGSNHGREGV